MVLGWFSPKKLWKIIEFEKVDIHFCLNKLLGENNEKNIGTCHITILFFIS